MTSWTEADIARDAAALGFTLLSLAESERECTRRVRDEGWTISTRTCPVTLWPLLSKNGVFWSVRLGMEARDAPPEAPAAPAEAPAKVRVATASDDDVSSRMGDRLLRGWTMLEETCPITRSCPLMKDPSSGRLYSAALDDFIDAALPVARAVSTTSPTTVIAAKIAQILDAIAGLDPIRDLATIKLAFETIAVGNSLIT